MRVQVVLGGGSWGGSLEWGPGGGGSEGGGHWTGSIPDHEIEGYQGILTGVWSRGNLIFLWELVGSEIRSTTNSHFEVRLPLTTT